MQLTTNPGNWVYDYAARDGFIVRITVKQLEGTRTTISLELISSGTVWATGLMEIIGPAVKASVSCTQRGISLEVRSDQTRYSARLIPTEHCILQVVERGRGSGVSWTWNFPGSQVHTHKQLAVISMPSADAKFRMGAFTQYGQLYDLKDWAVAQNGDLCSGLVAVQVGKWSHPNLASARATGNNAGLTIDLTWNGSARRSYLIVQAPTTEVVTPQRLGIQYFEPEQGHASWAAGLVSRYGTGRPERLAAARKMVESIQWSCPTHFLLGDDTKLNIEDFNATKQEMFATLDRFHSALTTGSYLHPLGNAVAIRPLAPTFLLFHLLDYRGHINDAERKRAAGLITDLADLLLRRDFYPHDYAMKSPEFPYGPDSFYRGMLNQNFNTDGYVMVGVAGCVLPQHPRSATWRRHAVDQFRQQMATYVWPGGAWEESHTYANHVKATLLPFILAMRNAPEQLDLMQNENFRQMCRFFANLLSPPDVMAEGFRGIPAIGDHGYHHGSYSYIFGWLAAASQNDPDHDLYEWAWQATGMGDGTASEHTRLLDPLLLPPRSASLPTPTLPCLMNLPGYGASYRGGTIGAKDETLLVVRCGQSWGHYHFDQGSFWWWAGGRLLCCDSGLGSGELKFAHRGHNVVGYPGREPLQFLDRQDFQIDQCEIDEQDHVHIRCHVTVAAWGKNTRDETRISVESQPHLKRHFQYDGGNQLTIVDEPAKSPDELVLWSLHVPCKAARQVDELRIEFEFDNSTSLLQLSLPTNPQSVKLERFGETIAVFCTYPQRTLQHQLSFIL